MPTALDTLHQVNDDLRSALTRLRPDRRHCSAIRPEDFSDLLSHLSRAKACLRWQPRQFREIAAFDKERNEYRNNVKELKHVLPDVQLRLLAEKSRLETARTHLSAAAEWAQSRRKSI